MRTLAKATFQIKSWDEKPYAEMPGAVRLTRATVAKVYKGEIEGEGQVEYLMAYGPDGSASIVGLERVIGRIGSRSGNFVFRHVGTFKDGVARSTWSVVPGSGAGDLQGLRGQVDSALGHANEYPVELQYELE
jgi:hypothetical protein